MTCNTPTFITTCTWQVINIAAGVADHEIRPSVRLLIELTRCNMNESSGGSRSR